MSKGKVCAYIALALLLAGSIFYFFSTITPPEQTRVIAHRGYWKAAGAAQNSIVALRAAQAIGVYGSEFDVNMTADDSLIVIHGPRHAAISDVQATTFDSVRMFPLSNGEQVPTLADYLDAGKENEQVKLILEIKNHATPERETFVVEKILEAVKAAGVEQQTEYISFSRHICEELVKRAPKADVAYLNGDLTPEELYNLEIDGLDYYYTTILENAEWVKQAHYWGLTVNIWTVNDEESMRKAIEQKINFITTDEPILLQQILRESK